MQRRHYAQDIKNTHLKESVLNGVAYHHAGMDAEDRKIIEDAFISGCLCVLTCTSTLAMGVNLPAHLVIIKNTEQYIDGDLVGYNSTQISQMVGRAGRPQFDDEGIAIIMTSSNLKMHYTTLLNTFDEINSCLKPRLLHHLLCEIILRTVYDSNSILNWIKNTFFYVRLKKFPQIYGLPVNCSEKLIDQYAQGLCSKEVNHLEELKLIKYDSENNEINATELGELIYKHNLEFDTLTQMYELTGDETTEDLLYFIANCPEIKDIRLRHCEKSALNNISRAKGRFSLRFPIKSRIKSIPLKVVCLLQAQLGQVTLNDYSLKQESEKIIQSASRILNALVGLLWLHEIPTPLTLDQQLNNLSIPLIALKYPCILNALELRKSIQFGRWLNFPLINLYNSSLMSDNEIDKLIQANILTTSAIRQAGCKKLENILNRESPFGLKLLEFLDSIPKYEVDVEQLPIRGPFTIELVLTIKQSVKGAKDTAILLVGDANKYLLGKWLLEWTNFEESGITTKHLHLPNDQKLNPISISLCSLHYGGVDLHTKYHFISMSEMHNHINPSSELFNKEISTEKELSIGYTELKTQNNSSTVNTWKNINNNNNNNNSAHPHDKFNLWPAPVSQPSHIIHPFYSNGSNKLDDLELPFTPVANKKMSVHQNENAKKRKMNIQSFQNKMQSKYAGQCSFKWTPTCQIDKGTPNTMTEKSMNTPLVQRSMLDYLKINNKISKSEPSKKHNPIEEMKKTFTPNTTVDADNSSRRSNRKRFKWDPNSQTSMDLDSSEVCQLQHLP
uniref:DNA 3'-5' helicase n=1 Tax=Trichobilharzia regenti TaxID=157069 RepID=A0AA85JXA7_TRIRE|nr:unnamed protein product [Trichobilharzia regenti]